MPQVNVPGVGVLQFPDGMSQQDMAAAIQKNYPQIHGAQQAPPSASGGLLDTAKNLYGSFLEPAAAMASGAVAKPLGDIAGLAAIPANALGLTDQDPAAVKQAVQSGLTYQPRTEAGQQATNLMGQAADKTLGAVARGLGNASASGVALLGGGQGAQEVARSGGTELGNQIPTLLGTRLPGMGQAAVADADAATVAAAPRAAAIQQAKQAGYKISPLEQGVAAPLGHTLPGVAGKAQVNDALSLYNQKITNNLAKQDLGIPETESLDSAAVAKVKSNAGAVYNKIKSADETPIPVKSPNGVVLKGPDGQVLTKPAGPVVPDEQYLADIKNIGADRANNTFGTKIDPAVQDLRDSLAKDSIPTSDLVDKITLLRQDARTNLNTLDDVSKKNLGRAQQQAADALEEQLGRYLSQDQPGLLKAYQQARTTLAKAHTIEDAMDASGNVDAAAINKYRNNGGYVDGNLKTVADAADSFKRTVRNTQNVQAPANFSALDYSLGALAGGLGYEGSHVASTAAAVPMTVAAARFAARKAIGSNAYQDALRGSNTNPGMLATLAANPNSPLAGLLANPGSQEQDPSQ